MAQRVSDHPEVLRQRKIDRRTPLWHDQALDGPKLFLDEGEGEARRGGEPDGDGLQHDTGVQYCGRHAPDASTGVRGRPAMARTGRILAFRAGDSGGNGRRPGLSQIQLICGVD